MTHHLRKAPLYAVLIILTLAWLLPVVSALLVATKSSEDFVSQTWADLPTRFHFFRNLSTVLMEYRLLEYLAMRAGEVVSRTDIWEHVYEFNSSASSNVVDVYIGYLRKKIEGPDRPALIHTLRGRGYLLGPTS